MSLSWLALSPVLKLDALSYNYFLDNPINVHWADASVKPVNVSVLDPCVDRIGLFSFAHKRWDCLGHVISPMLVAGNNCQPTNDPDRERGTSERGGLLPNKVPEHMSDTRFQIWNRGLGGD